MIFRRRPEAEPTRRQRLTEDKPAKLSSFAYSSNQAATNHPARQPGTQPKATLATLGRFWARRLGLLIFLVAAAASVINVLSLSASPKIVVLDTSGNQAALRDSSVYEAAANGWLKGSVWNHSKLTVDANGLSQYMLRRYPELASASVTIPMLAHRPLVYIQPAQPALILVAANGSFVIDTSGKVLSNVSSYKASLPSLTDQSGLTTKVNQQALPGPDVKFVQIIIAELAAKQMNVSGLTLPPTSNELDAYMAGQPYYVKFNLQNDDPAEQAGTFLATINTLKLQHVTPAHYVDVRVDGRAYYQ